MPSLRDPFPKKQDIQINSRAATQGIVRINQQSTLSLSNYLHQHRSINNDNNYQTISNNKIQVRSSSAPPATRIHSTTSTTHNNGNGNDNAVRKSQISFADYTAIFDEDNSMKGRSHRSNNKDVSNVDDVSNVSAPSTPYIAKLQSATSLARWASSSLSEYFESRGSHDNNNINDSKNNERVNDRLMDVNTHNTPTRRLTTEMLTSSGKKPISSLRRVFIHQNNATSAVREGSAGSLISSQAPYATES